MRTRFIRQGGDMAHRLFLFEFNLDMKLPLLLAAMHPYTFVIV